jgi:outer membrane protein assembly factor BamE (lipoprotein component of BamABCDE complex)
MVRLVAAAALRARLMGEDAAAVEALLGQPAFRDNGDRTWHYMDGALLKRVADSSVADQDLIVEFDREGAVSKVYLTD